MEAETLLDGEVLSVMLEMGTSAAAVAAELAPPGEIRTGDVVLVDEDGTLAAMLIPPLREAGYVVHSLRGRAPAIERLTAVAESREQPLVICDLLLMKESGGMLGGLDIATHVRTLEPPPALLLLAETMTDEVKVTAAEARVLAVVPRALKSDLKKSEGARKELSDAVLLAIDAHRPRAQWQTEVAGEWVPGEGEPESGWDVDELARRAEEVEDLPDFGGADPALRRDALWRETMRELAGPLSPPEILLQILRFGAEVLSRGVLFTPVGTDLRGFGQFGVELAPDVDPDEAVRQIRFSAQGHGGIARAIEEKLAVRWTPGESETEAYLTRSLGGRQAAEIFVGPVFCQGRLAALLFGDTLPTHDSIPDTTHLEVILGQAGLALDRDRLEARVRALEREGGSK